MCLKEPPFSFKAYFEYAGYLYRVIVKKGAFTMSYNWSNCFPVSASTTLGLNRALPTPDASVFGDAKPVNASKVEIPYLGGAGYPQKFITESSQVPNIYTSLPGVMVPYRSAIRTGYRAYVGMNSVIKRTNTDDSAFVELYPMHIGLTVKIPNQIGFDWNLVRDGLDYFWATVCGSTSDHAYLGNYSPLRALMYGYGNILTSGHWPD